MHFKQSTLSFSLLWIIVEGGDMSRLLVKEAKTLIKKSRMYAAEILLGIEALHKNIVIIYRDLVCLKTSS